MRATPEPGSLVLLGTGLVGFASGYWAMKDCDALLLLGTDFPYRQFFPENALIAQIDIRAAALGNRSPLDLGLIGSVKPTLGALLQLIEEKSDSEHLDWALKDYRKARSDLDAWAADPNHTFKTAVFDSSDGVRSFSTRVGYSPRVARSADGKLWFDVAFGVSVVDPLSVGGAALLLLGVALLASLLPAVRATRIDLVDCFRNQ